MIRNQWKLFNGIVLLTVSMQGALAGEAWLAITSDPPGAAILVDAVYRGVTPQRPTEFLRIQVPAGVRKISARVRIDNKEYKAQQTVKVISHQEIPVQFNLRKKPGSTTASEKAISPMDKSRTQPSFPLSLVPGMNF